MEREGKTFLESFVDGVFFFFFGWLGFLIAAKKGMDLLRETKGRMDGGWKLIKD